MSIIAERWTVFSGGAVYVYEVHDANRKCVARVVGGRTGGAKERASMLAVAPELAAAGEKLLAIIEAEEERAERAIPADPGCIECTSGTTPDRMNTGLCGKHAMRAALRKAGRE